MHSIHIYNIHIYICKYIYIYIYLYIYIYIYIYIYKIETGLRRVEGLEFPGVLKKYHVEILGVN